MNFGLHAIRRRQGVLVKTILALFALVWVQVAMVPCVMAADGLTAKSAGGSAAMQGSPAADRVGHDCPYCPPSDQHAKVPDAGGCSYPKQPQLDARTGPPLFLALPVTAVLVFAAMPMAPQQCHCDPGDSPHRRDPLAIVYCRLIQ